jgi:hypothetical protein
MEGQMADRPKEVQIVVETPPDYRPAYVTSAWGGPTPAGNLEVAFFFERAALPRSIVHAVTPSGGLGPELRREAAGAFVRHVRCGIVMSLKDAKSFSAWLQQQVRLMEEMQARGKPDQAMQ